MEKLTSQSHFQKTNTLNWKKLFLGPLKNNHGQTLITWLILMSVLLLVSISLTSGFVLIQDRLHVMKVCRIESLNVQRGVEPLIEKLFALNPQSRMLRVLMLAAKARLAAALAHYNFFMAARARIDISRIRNQQEILDRTQRSIVQLANFRLHAGTYGTYLKLKSAFAEIKSKNLNWAQTEFVLENPKVPKLAVKREDDDLAPAYLTRENFEIKQTSGQSWTQTYKMKGILHFTHRSHSQCNATLEENTWTPKIKKDKPSLR